MIDLLSKYWELVVTVFLGAIWVGRVSQRVTNLEKEDSTELSKVSQRVTTLEEQEPCMTVLSCGKQSSACQKYQETEFEHGKKEFCEIKRMIRDQARQSDDRHKLIMDHLLNNGNGKKRG